MCEPLLQVSDDRYFASRDDQVLYSYRQLSLDGRLNDLVSAYRYDQSGGRDGLDRLLSKVDYEIPHTVLCPTTSPAPVCDPSTSEIVSSLTAAVGKTVVVEVTYEEVATNPLCQKTAISPHSGANWPTTFTRSGEVRHLNYDENLGMSCASPGTE